jgi:hypothetical protein
MLHAEALMHLRHGNGLDEDFHKNHVLFLHPTARLDWDKRLPTAICLLEMENKL